MHDDRIFDFFMISNKNPAKFTAQPVHYEVIVNTTQLSKDEIEHLTYHQCYGYQGFQGPVKVPACVMYANKLAKFAVDNKILDKDNVVTLNAHLENIIYFI